MTTSAEISKLPYGNSFRTFPKINQILQVHCRKIYNKCVRALESGRKVSLVFSSLFWPVAVS